MTKILIVDDDQDLLVNMKELFKQNGFDIAVTLSCAEGLGILESFHPDLIFLDMNVGDQDGREMCKQIKDQADYKHIPIVFISGDHEALKPFNNFDRDKTLPLGFTLKVFAVPYRIFHCCKRSLQKIKQVVGL